MPRSIARNMEHVEVDTEFAASVDRVRSVLGDAPAFFETAGFDVEREADQFHLSKQVALARMTLEVRLREDDTAALAYNQVAGPFESMQTRYLVEPAPSGSRLTIETAFEPPTSGFGSFLNGAVVRRQRRAEFGAVESLLASDGTQADSRNEDRVTGTGGG
ncbi:MAG: SRPBCC family protein [Halorhabdus sp.]